MLSYLTVGRNIKAARERLMMTQADVANALDLSIYYYGKIERGNVKQSIERLAQLSELLSVPIESFFAGAMSPHDYTNQPPTENVENLLANIVRGCNKQRRDLILHIAKSIASLD